MADEIRIDVTTDDVSVALRQAIAAYGDLTPLMQDVGELMLVSTKENFAEGIGPDGNKWAPKSLTTLDRYRSTEGRKPNAAVPTRPLIGVTKMLSTTIAYEATSDAVAWGSNMIYAAVMHFGASRGAFGTASNGSPIPWGDIPARPFLGIGAEDENAILATIEEYLEQPMNG